MALKEEMVQCLVKDKQAALPVETEEAVEMAEGRGEEEEEEEKEEEEEVKEEEEEMEGVEVTNKPVEVQTANGKDNPMKKLKVQEDEEEEEGAEDRGEKKTSNKGSQVLTLSTAQ